MNNFWSKIKYVIVFILCQSALLGLAISAAEAQQPELQVKYAKSSNIDPLYKKNTEYFYELFNLALQKSSTPYTVKTIRIPASIEQDRSLILMNEGYYDAHWYTTNASRERELLPIRIPLFKGLIGLRLMFVHPDNVNMFADVNQVEKLKSYIGGQGRSWPDTTLLKSQGFHIETATGADGLLRMLNAKRIDYFPRSILEIWHEKNVIEDLDLAIDQHIAIRYPLAIYFFVRKDNQKLHDIIQLGLTNAIKDGSFDKIFNRYYSDIIEKSHLPKRKIFNLPNLNMTPATPLDKPELWYSIKNAR
ncbi:transporter substrate-binding domain-containing protein [Paraglaciecola aquimarina]|uniref:Transporter substrate-binding domain-containing protein n=1 Tax=Paraglaciecola algarum TaxID=3050085 RepID=A0ABS9D4P1_9ALTE|nr:transporter substrate-binding domain-containing protein [Paraglaciecola sp. G1-23]MCF2947400.1 transporter substrate-binding domain-containing protein [Paraglaciecola sp. G1-23]